MFSLRALGRFFGPWLAFASLSGIGGGLSIGFIISVFSLFAGIVTLIGGALNGAFPQAILEIWRAFPEFAWVVIGGVGMGFLGGFASGLLASLVGGEAGIRWSVAASFGLLISQSFLYSNGIHGPDITVPMAVMFGFSGLTIPHSYLTKTPTNRAPWEHTLSQWLRTTWLLNPPYAARFIGLILPGTLFLTLEIARVAPEFAQHPNYVARLGRWTVWWSSRRLATARDYPNRASCQSNLKQIMLGNLQYLQDFDEFYPPKPLTAQNGVAAVLQPYVKSTQLFQCPKEFFLYDGGQLDSGDFTDYWFNARFYGLNASKTKNPASSVMWGDGNTGAGEANAAYSISNLPANFAPLKRHLNGANYAFADGHVRWLRSGRVSNAQPASSGFPTMVP